MMDKVFINSICGRCVHVDVCSSIKDNRQKCGSYLEESPHETLESAINYLTEIGWLPEHDRILTETRPHGEWHTTPNPNHSPFDSTSEVIYMCSQCAYSSGDRITATWNFCPNCGSDMRVKTPKYVSCPCNHCRTFETTCKLTCDKYKKWKGGAEK